MARISDLPALPSAVQAGDVLPVTRAGQTYQGDFDGLFASLAAAGDAVLSVILGTLDATRIPIDCHVQVDSGIGVSTWKAEFRTSCALQIDQVFGRAEAGTGSFSLVFAVDDLFLFTPVEDCDAAGVTASLPVFTIPADTLVTMHVLDVVGEVTEAYGRLLGRPVA